MSSTRRAAGATLKEYDALMEHDAEYAEKAKKFTEKMRDISEFLAEIGITPPGGEIKRCVTYDEPCHLVHGQNVHDQPRQLLQSIPGLDFVELRESEWCCGSAGIYNITQPDMSRSILERKNEAYRGYPSGDCGDRQPRLYLANPTRSAGNAACR